MEDELAYAADSALFVEFLPVRALTSELVLFRVQFVVWLRSGQATFIASER